MDKKSTAFTVIKYVLLLCSCYICALIGRFFYHGGFTSYIIITLVSVALAYIGYAITQKLHSLLFLFANLLAAVYIGSDCATKYYYKIHSDSMSLLVGNIFTGISLGVTLLVTVILVVVKFIKNKKRNIVYEEIVTK